MTSASRKRILQDEKQRGEQHLQTSKYARPFNWDLLDSLSVGYAHVSSGKFTDLSRLLQSKISEDTCKLFTDEPVIREPAVYTSFSELCRFSNEDQMWCINTKSVQMDFTGGFCVVLCGHGSFGGNFLGSFVGYKDAHEVCNENYKFTRLHLARVDIQDIFKNYLHERALD